MKIIVCGGRNYSNKEYLYQYLTQIHTRKPITMVVHGAARGADKLAGEWAKENNVPVREWPANWNKYGNRAGPMRNRAMLEHEKDMGNLECVIAFPGGPGTKHMIETALTAGVYVADAHNKKLLKPIQYIEDQEDDDSSDVGC